MTRSTVDVARDLDALRASDFDPMRREADGIERLRNLCDDLAEFDVHEVAPMLLHSLERLEGCDLGSPGPIVHTLESMTGYESFLAESLARRPTALSAWMVNRIANADRPDKPKGLIEA